MSNHFPNGHKNRTLKPYLNNTRAALFKTVSCRLHTSPTSWAMVKVKSTYEPSGLSGQELIPVSVAWSDQEYSYPSLEGMLVHRGVTPSSKFAVTYLYTWVKKGTLRVKCLDEEHNAGPRPRLKPGPLDPESSALTIRPLRLPWAKAPKHISFRALHFFVAKCNQAATSQMLSCSPSSVISF